MKWTNWKILKTENLTELPKISGIYRIAINDKKFFKLTNKKYWRLYKKPSKEMSETINSKLKKTGAIRVAKFKNEIYTDLAYIGETDDLHRRLTEHLTKSNLCVEGLKSINIPLFFSVRRSDDPEKSEDDFFQKFIKVSEGVCPPADCNSNECSGNNGKNLPIKYVYKNRNNAMALKKIC